MPAEKIALITGASKGIGKALAEEFAQNGYALILIARNTAELTQLQQELTNKYQTSSKIFSIDLAKPDSIDVIMNAFKDDMKNVEVLVNNAGFGALKKFGETPLDEITGMLAVNMLALTKLTYRVLPFMLAQKRGKILNVASTAAFSPGPYMAVYYATKAYVLSLSAAIREEYKQEGVLVSALCPGLTLTGFQARAGMEGSLLMSGLISTMTPEKVASIAFKGVRRGKRVIIPGLMNRLSVFFMWLMPTILNTKMIGMLEKPKL